LSAGDWASPTSTTPERLALHGLEVAHEINNILTIIRTYTHFSRQASNPEQRTRDLRVVAAAAERGTVFTDWLGSIAEQRPRAVSTTSGRALLSTLALRLQLLTTPGTIIDLVQSAEDLYFLADQWRVEHLLSSLILTANLATTGEHFSLAFERARNAQNEVPLGTIAVTCATSVSGTNGASVSERLAGLIQLLGPLLATMNGALRLAAAGADGVVRFDLELPIADSAPARQVVPLCSLARQRKTVVVVEDDGAIRLAMQRTLSDAGHQVLEVSDGPDAQRLLSEMGLAVDLVVSDLVLPRGSGPDLFAWLKATFPRVALLLVSGREREGTEKSRELGVQFLSKPFYPAEFLSAVRVAIAAAEGGSLRARNAGWRPVVLIVDDDADIRESLDRLLRECDFETHVAVSAPHALTVLGERRIDAVIADQFMPGLDGIGLLEIVHDRYPQCTRILCTGRQDSDIVIDAVNRGRVHRVLAKTMHAVALRDEIERTVLESAESTLGSK